MAAYLTWPDWSVLADSPWLKVIVDQHVLGRIPAAVTQVQTSHERDRFVNHAEFLVM